MFEPVFESIQLTGRQSWAYCAACLIQQTHLPGEWRKGVERGGGGEFSWASSVIKLSYIYTIGAGTRASENMCPLLSSRCERLQL